MPLSIFRHKLLSTLNNLHSLDVFLNCLLLKVVTYRWNLFIRHLSYYRLSRGLRGGSGTPLLIGLDGGGGLVVRLDGVTNLGVALLLLLSL